MSTPTGDDTSAMQDLLRSALSMPGDEPAVHNVVLVDVTPDTDGKEILTVEWAGVRHTLSTGHQFNEFSQREVWRHGYLVRAAHHSFSSHQGEDDCYFRAYLDQSLRRAPELDAGGDCPGQNRAVIGWRCDAKPRGFRAPLGLVPGEAGGFIPDETISVTIHVPPEFVRLCRHYQLTPERMLRGFVGDASDIHNWTRCPRADGYGSNGSDERYMAQGWIDRAYEGLKVDLDAIEDNEHALKEGAYMRDGFASFFDEFADAGGSPDKLIDATHALLQQLIGQLDSDPAQE